MMKRFLLLVFSFCGLVCAQQLGASTTDVMIRLNDSVQVPLSDIINCNLPVLCFETNDGVEPTCEFVKAPTGCIGSTINAEKVPGRLVMHQLVDGRDSVLYDSGDYEKSVSGMTIRVRGNTSAREDKKPYKIKLQKKFDLLMRGVDSVYKDKDWLLMRDDHLFTTNSFWVNRYVGVPWVPSHHYVNVIINGSYRGVYLLCESVERNPHCRLNVDKDWGFVFECDAYWWNEPVYVLSKYQRPKYNYTFKYPDEDDITEEQLAYAQRMVNDYETIIRTADYPTMIDVRSFAAWTLVHDIVGTKDGGGANRFYMKYDSTSQSKIYMPLAWDFDLVERTEGAWSRPHLKYMTELFDNPNKAFVSEFVRLWCEIRETFLQDIKSYMYGLLTTPEGLAMDASYAYENQVWNTTHDLNVKVIWRYYWFNDRYEWLDSHILALRVPNDVNLDGVVDIVDVATLINGVLGKGEYYRVCADVNNDGQVDITDVSKLINWVLGRAD